MSRYRYNLHVVALALGVSVIASCAACQTPPTPPPAPVLVDASRPADAGDDCERMCVHLAALGCPEGNDPACAATCRHAASTRLVELAPSCVADCYDAVCVRACALSWRRACAGR